MILAKEYLLKYINTPLDSSINSLAGLPNKLHSAIERIMMLYAFDVIGDFIEKGQLVRVDDDYIKAEWIKQFLISLTAAYSAKHYDHNCMTGWRENEKFIHPSDAWLMAEKAYNRYKKENGNLGWDELLEKNL